MHQPETRNPVEELEETLQCVPARPVLPAVRVRVPVLSGHADELREVQGEIAFYLQLFPLVSHVDSTLGEASQQGL
uniref:Uncharacterized protein n=1 Tax=Arundo donax TaxID=35708 RepID=A0A0A9H5P3_ARUDO